jgi:serine protease Do
MNLKVFKWFFVSAFILFALPVSAYAQTVSNDFLRSNPKFVQSFREAVAPVAPSAVRIRCDGADACLGTIVGADGWILTKAHDLRGKIAVKLHDGREFAAEQIGVHQAHDLALLKINAKELKAVQFADSKSTRAGSWVASVGLEQDALAVGVVSVPTRKVIEAYLGVNVDASPQGVVVLRIAQKSPALQAGVRPQDIIVSLDGQRCDDPEQFQQRLTGYRPGEVVTLRIRRDAKEHEFKVTLQSREQGGDLRADYQNRLGSDLSKRRSGYAIILQHDSVLKPSDCGGPLVDLRGRMIGINISRAGRVETWAIPAEVAQPLIAELKKGR